MTGSQSHLHENIGDQFQQKGFDLTETDGFKGFERNRRRNPPPASYSDYGRKGKPYRSLTCQQGWEFFSADNTNFGFCYKVFSESANFLEAKVFCARGGAQLAAVHSRAEDHFLRRLVGPKKALLGLSRQDGKNYSNADGSPVGYKMFGNVPNSFQRCTVMSAFGIQGAFCEDQQNSFVCHTPSTLRD
ncbi:unnamed protein product [Caenorhabditis auriculariae]|uniref:C-type lectin domain-containing protein n=1 Tax=Caenorhabditis auriculariae TaxID=2777116 RepID=A0A8S1H4S4_9PELO|nr:unnamed protein product [Caenorhabditis auriculariae]